MREELLVLAVLLVLCIGRWADATGPNVSSNSWDADLEDMSSFLMDEEYLSPATSETDAAAIEEEKRQRQLREKRQAQIAAIKRTLQASHSGDLCDWRTNPIRLARGELCGVHYKVLGLSRFDEDFNRNAVKKAYRALSLAVHPDKNPSRSDAPLAFKAVQEAYDTLSSDSLRAEYETSLAAQEFAIAERRTELYNQVRRKTREVSLIAYHQLSTVAQAVHSTGLRMWDWADDWRVTLFNDEWSVGRALLAVMLVWKGQFLLTVQGIAYMIVRLNSELSRPGGPLRAAEEWSASILGMRSPNTFVGSNIPPYRRF